ncbi:TIGR03808 family TAT-translocated repetitive protein [Agrobacterium rhizogenes]|uniref:TIGR03808 family TAT-translocated repetitive protein n=1 Tax=Rhizobium rhizogenes TaxID=359 RepID=UPI001572EB1F|nr:TIGR03808 family TAT-translocated repetitive protein [Rhizobium rhizogenes]NTG51667.1 TIGR03808 family TAT-translocated repetitive protein [Rhizobium rhizogenes]
MTFYQKILDDRIIGINASSSPGTGWTTVASFPTMVTNARAQNLPLYLRPGTYPSLQIDVLTSTGSGNPLTLTAEVGTATIQLSGSAPYLFKANGVNNIDISNVIFDGNNVALTDSSQTAGLLHFSGSGITNFNIRNCDINNSTAAGISCDSGANGKITDNRIYNCDTGVFSIDCTVYVQRNRVTYCNNNGIIIWTSSINGNSSEISDNYIDTIKNNAGGTGQFGNGVGIYRAYNVKILNNTIFNCNYSAIRLNASGNSHVVGNYCYNLRETAIFMEAPGAGENLDGGVVANNIVNTAGTGILVVNSGLYGDGISRRVTVIGNQVSNLVRNHIPEEGGYTSAIGILVEGSCNVVGNNIENAARCGIVLGTNNASTDLTASGNFVHSCPLGVGYSANSSATGTLISSNLISNYTVPSGPSDPNYPYSGAIVSVSYNGTDYQRDAPGGGANTDYGNSTQTTVGPLTVGVNKAH